MGSLNPMQIATQRWYPIGLAGNRIAVGLHPAALAFDGDHLWVANTGSQNLTKIRVSDCAVQGTFGVTGMPVALAFDGGSVWALTRDSTATRLVKLRASSGSVAATYTLAMPSPMPADAVELVFDGVCLWVGWASVSTNYVTKVRVSDGAVLATVDAQIGVISAMAFDGSNVCVGSVDSEGVSRIRASDGVVLGVTRCPANAVAFDGEFLWAAGYPLFSQHSVAKIRASDGVVVGSFFPKVGGRALNALALAFDGASIWVTEYPSKVHKLRPADGVELGSWKVSGSFHAAAFDAANLWLADYDGNAVVKV